MIKIGVQTEDFDIGAEIEAVKAYGTDIGGIVSFTGTVRDLADGLMGMPLEHYPGMTEKELEKIAEAANKRWPLMACTIIHRHGTLTPGDNIVLVVTASKHRTAAFNSANYIMDFLKTRAPFWKKETTEKGDSWVSANSKDNDAVDRWT